MPGKPPVSLVRILARLAGSDLAVEFTPYRFTAADGAVSELAREGRRITVEGEGGDNVLSAATLSKAIRDGFLTSERREIEHLGRMIPSGLNYARPTEAGLALLEEWRWTLGSNESLGYAILKAPVYATRDVSPGPLVRVTSRTAARIGVDPQYLHPADDDRSRFESRRKGHGAKAYVELRDVLGFVDDPDDYAKLKAAHAGRLSSMEEASMEEHREVEEAARHIREKWAAKRREIWDAGTVEVGAASAAVRPPEESR